MSGDLSLDFDALPAGARFRVRVAHGMLLLSFCVVLAPFESEFVLAPRGFERVAFKRPVRIGDTIRLEGEVAAKKELDDVTGLVDFEWRVLNQRDELVARARPRVVWRRRGADGPKTADIERFSAHRRAQGLPAEVYL